MGLDVAGFVVASNRNDILTRWLETGAIAAEPVVPTISPSMDIQVSSNLERLLFDLLDRDGRATAELLSEFRATGHVDAPRPAGWWGARVDRSEEHTSELQSLMRISYAVFCLKKKKKKPLS